MAGTNSWSGKCYKRSSKAFKRLQGGKHYLQFALGFLGFKPKAKQFTFCFVPVMWIIHTTRSLLLPTSGLDFRHLEVTIWFRFQTSHQCEPPHFLSRSSFNLKSHTSDQLWVSIESLKFQCKRKMLWEMDRVTACFFRTLSAAGRLQRFFHSFPSANLRQQSRFSHLLCGVL